MTIILKTGSDTAPFELESEYHGPEPNPLGTWWYSIPLSFIILEDEKIPTELTKSSFTLKTSASNFIIRPMEVREI